MNFMTERVGDTPGLTQLYVPISSILLSNDADAFSTVASSQCMSNTTSMRRVATDAVYYRGEGMQETTRLRMILSGATVGESSPHVAPRF